jgi:hypothetical protein
MCATSVATVAVTQQELQVELGLRSLVQAFGSSFTNRWSQSHSQTHLLRIAAKLLAQREWCCVHGVCATNLDNVSKLASLVHQGFLQPAKPTITTISKRKSQTGKGSLLLLLPILLLSPGKGVCDA